MKTILIHKSIIKVKSHDKILTSLRFVKSLSKTTENSRRYTTETPHRPKKWGGPSSNIVPEAVAKMNGNCKPIFCGF